MDLVDSEFTCDGAFATFDVERLGVKVDVRLAAFAKRGPHHAIAAAVSGLDLADLHRKSTVELVVAIAARDDLKEPFELLALALDVFGGVIDVELELGAFDRLV